MEGMRDACGRSTRELKARSLIEPHCACCSDVNSKHQVATEIESEGKRNTKILHTRVQYDLGSIVHPLQARFNDVKVF